MRHLRSTAALATAVTLLLASRTARAAGEDDWFGSDKALHFGVSAGIGAGGYMAGALLFEARGHALVLGGALGLVAGAGKELLDLAGAGDPSWKDLTWDAIGTVSGLGLAWGLDLLVRGVSDAHPLLLVPSPRRDGGGVVLMVRF